MPTQARTANVSFLIKNILRTEYKPLHFFFRNFYIFFWLEDPRVLFQTLRVLPRFFNFFFSNGTVDPCMSRRNISDKPSIPTKFFLLIASSLFLKNYAYSFREYFSVLFRLVSVQKDICEDTTNRALRSLNNNLTKGGQITT